MNITSEKRTVVGTISTLVGRYSLLRLPTMFELHNGKNFLEVQVIDDEGFDNFIIVHGDFVIIPALVPTVVDARHVLTEEEAKDQIKALTYETID